MDNQTNTRKPWSFYMCSLTFSFERAAYYSSKWLVVAFLTAALVNGGLGIDKGDAAVMQSYFVAATYAAPVVMSFIADRYIGARYLIPVGLLLMAVGYAYQGYVGTKESLWIMISLVGVGTGFFKANLSSLTGTLFKTSGEKDSAFSTQYSFVNIGSFVGTTAVGILYVSLATSEQSGYLQCFKLAGLLCLLGAVWFVIGYKSLGDAGKIPFKAGEEKVVEVKQEKRSLEPYEVRRVLSILLISIFSIIFWLFWYFTYLAVYDYAPKYVNFNIGSFEIPTAWFDSENALLCIALGPILGALWLRLSKRPKGDLSLYKKLGIGLFLLGASFLMLIGAEFQRGIGSPETNKASLMWIIMFGILLSLGEMVFSPLGNAFVSKYSPKHLLSTMMSVWVAATFFATLCYGQVYKAISQLDFMYAYSLITVVLCLLGILLFVFDKKLASLVELREGETLVE
ncbi:peptide MFS transporter [Gemella sp. GH3]|uniref:peptide MFS transporter n=1 Tax=unclassified Gemella TaxID=2624949 RepID=UPI0015D00360|nr:MULTISPECIES: peptide MFS transporter [unclassified Gemella]MBF0714431.1 peptide MFS transporter [Gemella sp. GH3.1]NYS51383.1 peptide MFS transporter [Gemella sp. GH3]